MDKEDVVYIHDGILLSHKKKEILSFAATWMDLENIMLSEISQYALSYMWNLKNNTNECIRKTGI